MTNKPVKRDKQFNQRDSVTSRARVKGIRHGVTLQNTVTVTHRRDSDRPPSGGPSPSRLAVDDYEKRKARLAADPRFAAWAAGASDKDTDQ